MQKLWRGRAITAVFFISLLLPLAAAAENVLTLPAVQVQQSATGTFGMHLSNTDTPSALELEFTYNPTIGFDITNVALAERTQSLFDISTNITDLDATTKEVHILIFKMAFPAPTLPAGSGDIVTITYQTTAAGTGTTALTWNEASTLLSDAAGQAIARSVQNGSVSFAGACPDLSVCNGDFEQGTTFWQSTENAVGVDSGRTSKGIQVQADGANGDIWQLIPGTFMGGKTYQLSAWCKAETSQRCGIYFGDVNREANATMYEHIARQWKQGSGDWQQLTAAITMRHDERMNVYLYAPAGNVLYDDVMIQELACPALSVCNGMFEDGLTSWESTENAGIALNGGRTGHAGQVQADGANADIYQLLPGTFIGGQTYEISVWCKADAGQRCGYFFGDANREANSTMYDNVVREWRNGNGTWQHLRGQITLSQNERMNVFLFAPTGSVLYDDVMVTPITLTDRVVCNGYFEQGFACWESIENAALRAGMPDYGLVVKSDGGNSDAYQLIPGTFEASKSYKVTANCLADHGERCGLFLGDANTLNGPAYENTVKSWKWGTGDWQEISAVLSLSKNERLHVYLFAPVGEVVYDNVSIAEATMYTLNVSKDGSGSGVVTAEGIACGEDCTASYPEGTLLNLKADAAEGSRFTGWLLNGEPVTGSLPVEGEVNVTAVFEQE